MKLSKGNLPIYFYNMAIHAKLFEIQKKHLAFEKDTSNPFFKSKYVSLDSIVEKVTPLLDEQKLLALHYTQEKHVVTEIIDTEDGTSVKSAFPLIESNDPQKLGSCISYAKRYNLGQIFNIITDRDDDANAASGNDDKKEQIPSGKQDGSELLDIINEIKMAVTLEQLKELFEKGKEIAKTEKQLAWLTREKDAIKSSLTA